MQRRFILQSTLILFLIFISGVAPLQAQYYGSNSRVHGTWYLGMRAGNGWVEGDIAPQLPNFDAGIYGLKYLNRQLDVRFSLNAGIYSGQDFTPSKGFLSNPVLTGFNGGKLNYGENDVFFQNYQLRWIDLCFQLKININRLFSEHGHDDWDAFVLLGLGALGSETRMDAFNEKMSTQYDYSALLDNMDDQEELLQNLASLQDGIYESRAESDYINSTMIRGMLVEPQFLTGFGIRCKVAGSTYLGFLAEYNFVGNDLLDGQQWQELGENIQASFNNDKLLRLGLSIDWEIN